MHSVRAFLSPDDAIGFGLSDYVELAAAVLLAVFFLVHAQWRQLSEILAGRTGWCMLALGLLPIGLRLLLLPHHPVPIPSGSDDFGYWLLADTLRHLRLANPPHAFPEFFQQIYVLQQPTHSSIYPLGQGVALALGWAILGHPWAGVLGSTGALCALVYWMLRGWTTPRWALAGGVLSVCEFGPLSYWMNCYWGGAVSACAGCLVFGALPRLFVDNQQTSRLRRNAAFLGLGLGLQLLTRPYEFFLLLAAVVLFAGQEIKSHKKWRELAQTALLIVPFALACAGALMLAQNKQVTGDWRTIPYQLYRFRYGVPPTFTWQANAIPHGTLNSEQELDYQTETAVHGIGQETPGKYASRLVFRARFYRFFMLAPLYLALAAFVFTFWRRRRLMSAAAAILLFVLGANFFPYFFPHYIAAVTCLFVLACIIGLQQLNSLPGALGKAPIGTLLFSLCAAHFVFWYGVHALGSKRAAFALAPSETWDYLPQGDPQGRVAVDRLLAEQPGQQLVFVRYSPQHRFQEWIKNAADIDASPVVWVHDLGAGENARLRRYYPSRKVWLLEPDAQPPKLRPYPVESTPLFQDVP